MANSIDLTGQRFGRLIAVECTGSRWGEGRLWRCLCDCGTEVAVTAKSLRRGHTRSCGCLARDVAGARFYKHGASNGGGIRLASPEYQTWQGMKDRCYNTNDAGFHNYGARGIAMCGRWRESFDDFLADMGPRPSCSHSVDRIDVNGNYEPSNCRWATTKQQSRNRRNNFIITAFGESMVAIDWQARTGVHRETIKSRIRAGMRPEDAVTLGPRKRGPKPRDRSSSTTR